jgi:hypothetical protein
VGEKHVGGINGNLYKLVFNFVGCEIDKTFYDLQEKRWEEYKLQLELF